MLLLLCLTMKSNRHDEKVQSYDAIIIVILSTNALGLRSQSSVHTFIFIGHETSSATAHTLMQAVGAIRRSGGSTTSMNESADDRHPSGKHGCLLTSSIQLGNPALTLSPCVGLSATN